ncbi:MAG: UbiA prenyltransferase family protein [Candidatus Shapirobacteria bacterium]
MAPLVFSGHLFVFTELLTIIWCVFIFSLMTSATYLFNDLIDLESDRRHPIKKFRPLAAGELPIPVAVFVAVVTVFTALYLASWQSFFFFMILLVYLVLQILYTLVLKNIVVLDILTIASGFILRVYAGAFVLNVHTNVWFLLCVVSLSLFLASGKRRAELAILTEHASLRRKTLSTYTADTLDSYLTMFANSAWMAYALFTFFAPPPVITNSLWSNLPLTISGINKWLMITIPLVIFGLMRYLIIVYQGNRAEAPERILLSDRPLLISLFLWGALVIFILYTLTP